MVQFDFTAAHVFLSTPSGWRATAVSNVVAFLIEFLSTPSGWRATRVVIEAHGLPTFLSTPSGWRATSRRPLWTAVLDNFYPRPPGGGRPRRVRPRLSRCRISIHALRVEGDMRSSICLPLLANFYPRPPGGGRQANLRLSVNVIVFLSTPSGWRATTGSKNLSPVRFISIHALRVEGDKRQVQRPHRRAISIHALRVEGDCLSI